MKSKYLLILLLIIITTSISGWFLIKIIEFKSKNLKSESVSLTPQPVVPALIRGQQPEYQAPQTTSYPSQIPAYTISQAPALKDAKDTAVGLGFLNPKTTTNNLGSYLFYNQKTSSLIISTNPLYISYSIKNPDKTTLFETKPEAVVASDFFNSLNQIAPLVEMRLIGVNYYKAGASEQPPVSDFALSNVAVFNYQYYLDNLPFFIYNPGAPSVSVDVAPINKILAARFHLLPNLTKNPQAINIVSYDEAVKRLNSNKSVLVQVETDPNKDAFVFVNGAPKTVTVNRSELGYYYSTGASDLSAVFVFYGKGTKNNLELNTITVVSAIP